MNYHGFNERLDYSLQQRHELFWKRVYKQAFPNLRELVVVEDLDRQRIGIDREVHLTNGDILLVDEKKREKTYDDIALETHHTVNANPYSDKIALGWIQKTLSIDFVAYAFMDTKTVYFFQWHMLQRAFELYKVEWYAKYNLIRAKNKSYYSHSLCVPIEELYSAITNASKIVLGD